MASRRLTQMDKNIVNKLLTAAMDNIHVAQTAATMPLPEAALKLIENNALDLVASVRNYRMKQRSPIFTEGQKA